MKLRLWSLCVFLFLLSYACGAEVKLEVKPLAPGVWLHTSWQTTATWGLVPSNGLIVREADHVVVIDTAWGAEPSRALLAWIERELDLPVARLIATHFHDDCLGGWEVFAERGARIVVSAQTLALAHLEVSPEFEVFRLAPGETHTAGELEIFYPGPAHAPDNIVVWLPGSRILFGGCAIRAAASGGLGNLSDAVVSEWATSISRVQTAFPDARIVLPGHGDIGGPELLAHTRELAEAANRKKSN